MGFEMITSRDNAGVKQVVKLNSSAKFRRTSELFVLEGLRLCRDAALNNYHFKTLYLSGNFYDKNREVAEFLIENSEQSFIASQPVIEKMSETANPQGVIAVCVQPESKNGLSKGFYVGMENLSDPSNLGAIARTAEAFGAEGLVLLGSCCDPYSPKSLRAGMGALLRLPVFTYDDFEQMKAECKRVEKQIFASVVDNSAQSVITAKKQENAILLIGNEANGITKETAEKSDARITIPMRGRAESLNAAAAAAVLIWEFLRKE